MPGRNAWRPMPLVLAALALVAAPDTQAASAASRAGLAHHDGALVALGGGRRAEAEQLVRSAGGRLVSARLRLWRLSGRVAAHLAPRLERLGALRYAEPERARLEGFHFTDPLAQPD